MAEKLTNEQALHILRLELPCYDHCPCSMSKTCDECDFQKAVDMAVESMKKMDKIEKALDKISELGEMDAFGDFQLGIRSGLWKAQTIVKEAMEK